MNMPFFKAEEDRGWKPVVLGKAPVPFKLEGSVNTRDLI
jgi:hypothetical protein